MGFCGCFCDGDEWLPGVFGLGAAGVRLAVADADEVGGGLLEPLGGQHDAWEADERAGGQVGEHGGGEAGKLPGELLPGEAGVGAAGVEGGVEGAGVQAEDAAGARFGQMLRGAGVGLLAGGDEEALRGAAEPAQRLQDDGAGDGGFAVHLAEGSQADGDGRRACEGLIDLRQHLGPAESALHAGACEGGVEGAQIEWQQTRHGIKSPSPRV